MVWWPTPLGWCCLGSAPAALLATWILWGESFLSITRRVSADTLVVEGWIHSEGMPVAKNEFERGGYHCLVITGGPSGPSWAERRPNLAESRKQELLHLGMAADQLFAAPCDDSETQRTYESALAAKRMMEARGIHPAGINVLSRGAHARRTAAVYAKVFGPSMNVGIIAWQPYAPQGRSWWRSSERSKELIDESLAYVHESLLNSGRPDGRWRMWMLVGTLLGFLSVFVLRRWRRRSGACSDGGLIDLPARREDVGVQTKK
jgi:hypothetical protein